MQDPEKPKVGAEVAKDKKSREAAQANPPDVGKNIKDTAVAVDAALAKPEDNKFSKAVPVEEIIPNIKIPRSEVQNSNVGYNLPHPYLMDRVGMQYIDNMEYFGRIPVRKLIKDQIIVDLGAGSTKDGYLLSEELGARAYIGVDEYYSESLKRDLENSKEDKKIPFSVVSKDMLTFLRGLPDNSVSILMSGINASLLSNERYRKEVLAEIERVLDPEGAFLSFASDINPEALGSWVPNTQDVVDEGKNLKRIAKDFLFSIWSKKRSDVSTKAQNQHHQKNGDKKIGDR